MKLAPENLFSEISNFVGASPTGFLQLLVAAAKKSTFNRIINCPTYPAPAGTAGVSRAVRQFRQAMRSPDIHLPTFLAQLYISVTSLPDRKQAGQFFTAQPIAEWALTRARLGKGADVCDAGAGSGVFAEAIMRTGTPIRSYIGVENDPILALCAAHVLESLKAPASYKIWYANFMLLDVVAFKKQGLRAPTFVVANPPFVRSRKLVGGARIRTSLKSSLGITLSSFSGSMAYFLIRAAELAGSANVSKAPNNPAGRLLFLLPKEAEGAAHAQLLRNDLRRMHGWTCREWKMPITQTGVDRHASNTLALLFVFEQKRLMREPMARQSKEVARVRDLLHVRRGVSTGCNEFFVLSEEDVRRRRIDEKWLKRVLPTRIHVPELLFSLENWETLRESGHKCWLLALPNCKLENFETPIQEYLKEGLRRGLHSTPTAKALRTWYSLPIPSNPPDIFVTYFFRGVPRFILNDAQVFHLTNILGGRFVQPVQNQRRKQMIIQSLNTQAAGWIEGKAGREYKGGLRKIEPRELSMLPVDPATVQLVAGESRVATASSGLLFD